MDRIYWLKERIKDCDSIDEMMEAVDAFREEGVNEKLDYPVASCCVGQSSCDNYHRQKPGIAGHYELRTKLEKIAFCHGCLSERWRIINLDSKKARKTENGILPSSPSIKF